MTIKCLPQKNPKTLSFFPWNFRASTTIPSYSADITFLFCRLQAASTYRKLILEAASCNESQFSKSASCPLHINNSLNPKSGLLSVQFPHSRNVLILIACLKIWLGSECNSMRWGPESYQHKAVYFLSVLLRVRPHLQHDLLTSTDTWPLAPTQLDNVN